MEKLNQKYKMFKNKAAVMIQKHVRRKTAVKKCEGKRAEKVAKEKRTKAAVFLQKHSRRKTACKVAQEKKARVKAKKENKAAMRIQSHVRRRIASNIGKEYSKDKRKGCKDHSKAFKAPKPRAKKKHVSFERENSGVHEFKGSFTPKGTDTPKSTLSSFDFDGLSTREEEYANGKVEDGEQEEDPFADLLGSNDFALSDSFYVQADVDGWGSGARKNGKKKTLRKRRGSLVNLSIDPVAYGEEPEREIIISAPSPVMLSTKKEEPSMGNRVVKAEDKDSKKTTIVEDTKVESAKLEVKLNL